MVIIFFWISLWMPARRYDWNVGLFCICILMTLCTVNLHHVHLHQLIILYKVSLMTMPIEPSSSKIIYWYCLSNQHFVSPSLLCPVVVSPSGLYMVTNDHGKVRANTKINPDSNLFMSIHASCLLVLFDVPLLA